MFMRKITQETKERWDNWRDFKCSNTEIKDGRLRLFGVQIAMRLNGGKGQTVYSMAGWNTVTTRERLKAIGVHIQQQHGRLVRVDDNCDYETPADRIISPNAWYFANTNKVVPMSFLIEHM